MNTGQTKTQLAKFMKTPVMTPLCALLLDDDPFISELVAEMLAEFGMQEIYLESDPHHAITTLMAHQPELLICDLAIPDMDGIEFLKTISQKGYTGGVIVLSGLTLPILKAAHNLALANGLRVLGTFAKPLQRSDLKAAIGQLHRNTTQNQD